MIHILIVDDEKIEREGLKYLLSIGEGERKVFEASNGKQALQILRTEEIQLLLTDIKMPHMDGLELSRKAKEEKPDLQVVIFRALPQLSVIIVISHVPQLCFKQLPATSSIHCTFYHF